MSDRAGENEPGPPGSDVVRTPLSFKVMVTLAVLYLLYRLGQGVVWLFQALTG